MTQETTTQNANLAALSAAGVSVWLDDLSRERIESGNLAELVATRSVVGVTTNPSIFQAALSKGHAYDAQITELAAAGSDVVAIDGRGVSPWTEPLDEQVRLLECPKDEVTRGVELSLDDDLWHAGLGDDLGLAHDQAPFRGRRRDARPARALERVERGLGSLGAAAGPGTEPDGDALGRRSRSSSPAAATTSTS